MPGEDENKKHKNMSLKEESKKNTIAIKKIKMKHFHMKNEVQDIVSTTDVISQVVGDHLFEGDCSSVDIFEDESDVELKNILSDVSSSEDEYNSDEILLELRNRRRKIKDELKDVENCLFERR